MFEFFAAGQVTRVTIVSVMAKRRGDGGANVANDGGPSVPLASTVSFGPLSVSPLQPMNARQAVSKTRMATKCREWDIVDCLQRESPL